MASKLFWLFTPSAKNLEHILPIYVYLLFLRYIHVLLKFFPHPNELSCMHPTLETAVTEDLQKQTHTPQTQPNKHQAQNWGIRTDICSHKPFGCRESQADKWRVPPEELQCQSLQPPAYTRCWDASWSARAKVALLGFFPVCLIYLPSSHTSYLLLPGPHSSHTLKTRGCLPAIIS